MLDRAPIRKIVIRNEDQGTGHYDVLVCKHAVRVTNQQCRYRRFRMCPVCHKLVKQYRRQHRKGK